MSVSLALKGGLAEYGGCRVLYTLRTKHLIVTCNVGGPPGVHDLPVRAKKPGNGATVDTACAELFGKRVARGQCAARHRSTLAIFRGDSKGREGAAIGSVIPEKSWTQHHPGIAG